MGYVMYDCGFSDADHCELQSWMDIHELILGLYESVCDIHKFTSEFSGKIEDKTEMMDASQDIQTLCKPALAMLQKANNKIRTKYRMVEKEKGVPIDGAEISK